ncbi:MAG TPA: DNA polymerase I [Thermoanaerobaculia bacterium]|jgi:DNA polymerase-1
MATPDRVILVDGSALLYRAFHALPSRLSTASGLLTNAVYGFATTFKKLLSGRRPRRGAVVFDPPGPTFRDERYPAYKADRPPMPGELAAQIPAVERLVAAHNFPLLRVAGYEADDVIGTLTRQAVEAGMEVYIVSGDKDFAQLVGDDVRVIDTLRDVVYDRELVRKKWGVAPEQFVDFLALTGDRVDGIPGVPGIGAKGAARLLAGFGSLDGVLARLDELPPRQRSLLEEHRESALLSRELAAIDRHVPLDVALADLEIEPPAAATLNALFKELEFFSLLSEEETARQAAIARADYAACRTLAELDELLASLPSSEPVALLPIHDKASPIYGELAALAFCAEPGRARLVPLFGRDGLGAAALERLAPWLLDRERPKVTYNAKFLWIALRRQALGVDGLVGDVLLESFLVEPVKVIPHHLGQIAREYLRVALPPEKQVIGAGQKQKLFTQVRLDKLVPWACQRADAVAQAWPILRRRLIEEGHLDALQQVELPMAWVLGEMELAGIGVDPRELARMGQDFAARLDRIQARIFELAGREFNVGSHQQLGAVLFDELGLPVLKRTKSGYSTDADVLARLAGKHEIARQVLGHRKLAKLINTYTEVLVRSVHPRTGRIHATFQQTASATGRLISTEPDLQRTPIRSEEGKRIRQCFVARRGSKLISADWSQIELRLLAHFTGDELLVKSFCDGADVHRRTAAQLHGCAVQEVTPKQREVGKTVNFATIYGQGATSLGKLLDVPRQEAQRTIDDYFAAYRGVRSWLDRTIAEAHEKGYVTTLIGRRRYVQELRTRAVMERQAGERIAANTPIQGSAADLCKMAMIAIARRLAEGGFETRMVLQIHDELVFEAPVAEVDAVVELVRREMVEVYPLTVPLAVDVGVGDTWGEAHL